MLKILIGQIFAKKSIMSGKFELSSDIFWGGEIKKSGELLSSMFPKVQLFNPLKSLTYRSLEFQKVHSHLGIDYSHLAVDSVSVPWSEDYFSLQFAQDRISHMLCIAFQGFSKHLPPFTGRQLYKYFSIFGELLLLASNSEIKPMNN